MKSRFLIAVVAFLGYAIIDGQAASAADTPRYYIDTANDDWSDGDNWDSVGCTVSANPDVPASGDSIIICPNTKVTMVSPGHSAPTVRVEEDGVLLTSTFILTVSGFGGLDIDRAVSEGADPGILRVSGEAGEVKLNGGGAHPIDGHLKLEALNARLNVIDSNATLGVSPFAGSIIGSHDGAVILSDGVTLTNEINIEGAMVIKDANSGTFLNYGVVNANASGGTLDMQATTIDDNDTAEWKVEDQSDARLLFTVEPDPLEGDFTVRNGILQAGLDPAGADNINVVTEGTLTHETAGEIRVLVDDSFHFNAPAPP